MIRDSPVAHLIQDGISVEFSATLQHDDRKIDQNEAINDVNIIFYYIKYKKYDNKLLNIIFYYIIDY